MVKEALAGQAVALTGDERGHAEFPETLAVNDLVTTAVVTAVLAVMAGLFGIGSTLALALSQRLREMALLRAVGATPAQLRRMIRVETLVVAVLGAAMAVLPGDQLGQWLFLQVVASGIAPAGIQYRAGAVPLAVAGVLAVATAVIAASAAGRRASRTPPTARPWPTPRWSGLGPAESGPSSPSCSWPGRADGLPHADRGVRAAHRQPGRDDLDLPGRSGWPCSARWSPGSPPRSSGSSPA